MLNKVVQTRNEKGNFVHTKEVSQFRDDLLSRYGVNVSWNKKSGLGDEFNAENSTAKFTAKITGARRHSSSVMSKGIAKTVLSIDKHILVSYSEELDADGLPTGSYVKRSSNELWLTDSEMQGLFGMKQYNPLKFDELRLIDLKITFSCMLIDKAYDARLSNDAVGFSYNGILFLQSAGVRALNDTVKLDHKMKDLYNDEFSEMADRIASDTMKEDATADAIGKTQRLAEKAKKKEAFLKKIKEQKEEEGLTEEELKALRKARKTITVQTNS